MYPNTDLTTFKDHIFVIVPRKVNDELDWRLPVFERGWHLIAFDAAAWLLNDIYEQREGLCWPDRLSI